MSMIIVVCVAAVGVILHLKWILKCLEAILVSNNLIAYELRKANQPGE